MKQIIFIVILTFVFYCEDFAQLNSQKTSKEKTKTAVNIETGKEITEIFEVLFYGLDLKEKQIKAKSLQLSKSNEKEVLTFLKNFPVNYNKIANSLNYEKRYRYIQAYYRKYFMVFSLGNESNRWKDKLYSISFNITFPNKEIAEDETSVYKKLKQLYGEYTKTEKFRYSAQEESELNLYIWEFPDITVTYRSFYDAEKRETPMVVEYWDTRFYKTYPYYEF